MRPVPTLRVDAAKPEGGEIRDACVAVHDERAPEAADATESLISVAQLKLRPLAD